MKRCGMAYEDVGDGESREKKGTSIERARDGGWAGEREVCTSDLLPLDLLEDCGGRKEGTGVSLSDTEGGRWSGGVERVDSEGEGVRELEVELEHTDGHAAFAGRARSAAQQSLQGTPLLVYPSVSRPGVRTTGKRGGVYVPDCSETSSKSVPWISVEMPTSDFRSASLEAAYTILGRILAPSGVLNGGEQANGAGRGRQGEGEAEGGDKAKGRQEKRAVGMSV